MDFNEIAAIIPTATSRYSSKWRLPKALESVKNAGAIYVINNHPDCEKNQEWAAPYCASLIHPQVNLHHPLSVLVGIQIAIEEGFSYALSLHDDMEIQDQEKVLLLVSSLRSSGSHVATCDDHTAQSGVLYWANWLNFSVIDLDFFSENTKIFEIPFLESKDARNILDANHFISTLCKRELPEGIPKLHIDKSFPPGDYMHHVGSGTRISGDFRNWWKWKFDEDQPFHYQDGRPSPFLQQVLDEYRKLAPLQPEIP